MSWNVHFTWVTDRSLLSRRFTSGGIFPGKLHFLFVLNPWLQNQDQETAIFIKIEKGRYNENEHDCQLIFVPATQLLLISAKGHKMTFLYTASVGEHRYVFSVFWLKYVRIVVKLYETFIILPLNFATLLC